MDRFMKKKPLFHTTRLIVYSFLAVIITAAMILMLPVSSSDGQWTDFLTALFTATTSVCVTGLVVVPTYAHWSLFGKVVILILIQLGGLGIICITMGFFILIKKRITVKERRLIQESYNLDSKSGMVKMIVRVFKATFTIEAIGALLFSIRFIPAYGVLKGIWFSVFHSVSAFCNAGLDIIGGDSLAPYCTDALFNFTAMFLIVSGGLGFIVWWDILNILSDIRKGKVHRRKFWERLPLHSKLAITATVFFIITGAVLFFCFEFQNEATIGNMNPGEKMLVSLFESVTLRTAGFATISQAGFGDASFLIICLLMLVGGSPMGTAGGIKTTTIAILFIEVAGVVRGKKNAEVFRRKISTENVRTAISVILIGIMFVSVGIIILTFTENQPFRMLIFEAVSAIGTVGLSMDCTALLSDVGRLIIIILMFAGRIGPITLAMAFSAKRDHSVNRDLPERNVIIG